MSLENNSINNPTDFGIIGAGFTGLTISYELTKLNKSNILFEKSNYNGGLASSFKVGSTELDKFYHHWFTSDDEIISLIKELDLEKDIITRKSNTGMYYANKFYKLSTPLDLLKFKALNIFDRIKLGILTLQARRVKNWHMLEAMTAKDWLISLGGKKVYNVVWDPLLTGKFGPYADKISAVWFWNKIKLRGGSRDKSGDEKLAYLRGGFVKISQKLESMIQKNGNKIKNNEEVISVSKKKDIWEIKTSRSVYYFKNVICTSSLKETANMLSNFVSSSYLEKLNKIDYIGNICLVLELKKSLSSTYWLNVNDPNFPFVGVIEHTNFEGSENYDGRHIVYLSKYLPTSDKLYNLDVNSFYDYAEPYLKKMFPDYDHSWLINKNLWKARYSQPIVVKNYSSIIPEMKTPYKGLYICTMAQIYPEDRGTNYAVKYAKKLIRLLQNNSLM